MIKLKRRRKNMEMKKEEMDINVIYVDDKKKM
jgi:hypothetical protein